MSSQEQRPKEESMLDKAKKLLSQKVTLLGYELTYGMILVVLLVLIGLYQYNNKSNMYVARLSPQLGGKITAFLQQTRNL